MGSTASSPSGAGDAPRHRRPSPPLVPWAIGVALGIGVDEWLPLPPYLSVLGFILPAAAWLIPPCRARAAPWLAVIAATGLGALVHHRDRWLAPVDHLVRFTSPEPSLLRLRGRVLDRPRTRSGNQGPFAPWLPAQERTTCLVDASFVEAGTGWRASTGLVRVSIQEPALAVQQGDLVEIFGWLYRPHRPRNPGQFDWSRFNARRGIWTAMNCDNAACVRVLASSGERNKWSLPNVRDCVRRALLDDRIETGDELAPLLDAMILGRRTIMDREREQLFVDTGCAHYLAASGTNVAMLAVAVWAVATLLGAGRRGTAIVTALATVAYALLADPETPIIRAAIMACAVCLAFLTRRMASFVSGFSLAAVVILLAQPEALFDAGFQLSFTGVAAIVWLAPAVDRGVSDGLERLRNWRSRSVSLEIERLASSLQPRPGLIRLVLRAVRLTLTMSVAAWLCSLPIVAVHFGRVAIWGWLASFAAAPLVFAVTVLGFLKVCLSLVAPVAAGLVDPPLDLAARLLVELLGLFTHLPALSLHVPSPPTWLLIAYYGVLAVVAAGRWRSLPPAVPMSLALAVALAAGGWLYLPARPPGVRIGVLAVGKALSTVVQLPDGAAWLYDAGSAGSADPGTSIIAPYLDRLGVRRITGICLSHPNLDHFSGVLSVVDRIPAGPIYISPYFRALTEERLPSFALLAELETRRHALVEIDSTSRLDWGEGARAEVLWPTPESPPSLSINDSSIVLRVSGHGYSVLLTGDIEAAAQRWLIQNEDISADVLVLPHHGSMVTGTPQLIQAVNPTVLVQSSSTLNKDNPDLARAAAGRTVFNTAEVGAVEIELSASGLTVHGLDGPVFHRPSRKGHTVRATDR